MKRIVLLAVGCSMLVAGCAFWKSNPTTPQQQISLSLIHDVGKAACMAASNKWPDQMQEAKRILDEDVLPGIEEEVVNAELPSAGRAISSPVQAVVILPVVGVGFAESGAGFDWEVWIGPALSLAKAYAVQEGVLDTSATYWLAVKAGVVGCRDGIN